MRAVVLVARAELRSQWRAWLGATLLVALASGVVLAAVAGARRTDTSYGRLLRSRRAADVAIAVSDPEGRQNVGGVGRFYADVARLDSVEVLAPTVGMSATVSPPHGSRGEVTLRAGTDAEFGSAIEVPKLTAGRMFDPARSDEVVVDHPTAARLHLKVGDALHLRIGPSGPPSSAARPASVAVDVVGIGVTRDNVVPVTALAVDSTITISPALLGQLSRSLYGFDAAFIRLHQGASLAGFRQATEGIVSKHAETGGHLFVVDENLQARKVEHAIHPQAVALLLFALLVAATSLPVIGQVLGRQIALASTQHSTLRALGLRGADLRSAGLVVAGIVVGTGTLLALMASVAMSATMPIGPARVAEPHPGVAVNVALLASCAMAMIALFALRMAPTIWRLSAVDGATDRSSRSSSNALGALARAGGPVSLTMGARFALERRTGQGEAPVRSTIAGTVLAVAAVAAAATFGANLIRLVDTPALYGQTWSVAVDANFGQLPPPVVDAFLQRSAGVRTWTYGDHAEVQVAGRAVPAIELARGRGDLVFPTLLEGRAPRASNEIALGSRTLSAVQRRVGDKIPVALSGQRTERRMTVVGPMVFPFFGQGEVTPTGLGDGAAILSPRSRTSTDGYNFVLIDGPQPQDVARLSRRVASAGFCSQDCTVATRQRPTDVSNYARISGTPLLLALVLAVLALATIAHLLVTSIRRRRHDFAVFRTIGFVRRQVSATVTWQATLVMGSALVVGLPTGAAAGRWAWIFFAGRLGVARDPMLPVGALLVAVPVALILANAIASVAARIARRSHPATILRAE